MSEEIISSEKPQITNVSVSMRGTGYINETTTIENTYNIDILSSGVVGLVGVPVNIESTSEFDEATITFTYDEAFLGDTAEEDLRILWYDEENNQYVIMAKETGGTFYYAATAEEIREAIWGVQDEIIGEIDTTDTDGDNLYDIYETAGMMLPNGQVMYSDSNKPDSDDDGLDDDKEMGILIQMACLMEEQDIQREKSST